jgi:PIN domain nuclease of toxin-antitoxin system
LILLDTQILVWFTQGDAKLRAQARRVIEQADEIVTSSISFWEVAMLVEKGRISLGRDVADWVKGVLGGPGLHVEAMSALIAVDAGRLPGQIHGDPADRMVIATARHLGCPVLTTDRKILAYSAQGHVQAIDARL